MPRSRAGNEPHVMHLCGCRRTFNRGSPARPRGSGGGGGDADGDCPFGDSHDRAPPCWISRRDIRGLSVHYPARIMRGQIPTTSMTAGTPPRLLLPKLLQQSPLARLVATLGTDVAHAVADPAVLPRHSPRWISSELRMAYWRWQRSHVRRYSRLVVTL